MCDASSKQKPKSDWIGPAIATLLLIVLVLGFGGECAGVWIGDKPDESKWMKAEVEMGEIRKALLKHALAHDGEYPKSLSAISGSFPELPQDPFTKRDFAYARTDSGFELVCLGADHQPGGKEIPDKDIIFTEQGER